MIHPMIFKQNGSILLINGPELVKLVKHARSILWHNKGLYAIVPIERVMNAVSVFKDRQYCKKSSNITFHWSEAVEIPEETGRAMEKYNGGKDE